MPKSLEDNTIDSLRKQLNKDVCDFRLNVAHSCDLLKFSHRIIQIIAINKKIMRLDVNSCSCGFKSFPQSVVEYSTVFSSTCSWGVEDAEISGLNWTSEIKNKILKIISEWWIIEKNLTSENNLKPKTSSFWIILWFLNFFENSGRKTNNFTISDEIFVFLGRTPPGNRKSSL